MAKHRAEIIEEWVNIIPASRVQYKNPDGTVTYGIELPEKRFYNRVGEIITFDNKKELTAFLKGANGSKVKLL